METNNDKPVLKVVIDGPESTGKTELSMALGKLFGTTWVPEFAREYVSGIQRPYTYDDVLYIAEVQASQLRNVPEGTKQVLFYDTDLIITKVWMDIVFRRHPQWIDQIISNSDMNLYLLCKPDIPWIPDPLRENGGPMREVLFERYRLEIEHYGFPWYPVTGFGEQRTLNALSILKESIGIDL